MQVPFVICDVFTDVRFGGNPLAVITDARGVTDADMQRIAREFGFSETTFVLPADAGDEGGATHRVRIFAPSGELPFAGHPNVGTAFVLAAGEEGESVEAFRFREGAGLVEVSVARDEAVTRCEFRAPEAFRAGDEVDPALVARACGLVPEDISTSRHVPVLASVGLPFVVAEVVDRAALARARPDVVGFGALTGAPEHRGVHLYCRQVDGSLDCRMFSGHGSVSEDAATGSANAALGGLLASLDPRPDGEIRWTVRQGEDMGRPSRLAVRVVRRGGEVEAVHVGGRSVWVADGMLRLGD